MWVIKVLVLSPQICLSRTETHTFPPNRCRLNGYEWAAGSNASFMAVNVILIVTSGASS